MGAILLSPAARREWGGRHDLAAGDELAAIRLGREPYAAHALSGATDLFGAGGRTGRAVCRRAQPQGNLFKSVASRKDANGRLGHDVEQGAGNHGHQPASECSGGCGDGACGHRVVGPAGPVAAAVALQTLMP